MCRTREPNGKRADRRGPKALESKTKGCGTFRAAGHCLHIGFRGTSRVRAVPSRCHRSALAQLSACRVRLRTPEQEALRS